MRVVFSCPDRQELHDFYCYVRCSYYVPLQCRYAMDKERERARPPPTMIPSRDITDTVIKVIHEYWLTGRVSSRPKTKWPIRGRALL